MIRKQSSTWVISFLILACAILHGCASVGMEPEGNLSQITVAPPVPSSTPIVCSDLDPGLMINITTESQEQDIARVLMKGSGFSSSRKVTIIIQGVGSRRSVELQAIDIEVTPQGEFTSTETIPILEAGMDWKVFIVHENGIACVNLLIDQ